MSGGEGGRLVVDTERLRLTAMNLEALQAWIDGDGRRLFEETGVRFDDPRATPPLFGEDLPNFRDRMAEAPEELGWWVWLVALRHDGRAVGVCGLGGPPDASGVTVLGYAVYGVHEGRGYATEAAHGVVGWAFSHPEVSKVRARVPAWNRASARVALKLGMRRVGVEQGEEVGEVVVYEVVRPA